MWRVIWCLIASNLRLFDDATKSPHDHYGMGAFLNRMAFKLNQTSKLCFDLV